MKPARIAVVGVGNNISALVQGVQLYREMARRDPNAELPGVSRADLGGLHVTDLDFVAAFDVARGKVGLPLREAVFAAPNNYPRIVSEITVGEVRVSSGVVLDGVPPHLADVVDPIAADRTIDDVADDISASGAEVLLYSLPTGSRNAVRFYAECAIRAGVAFVNCTPDFIARDPDMAEKFARAGVPVVGDDLASHIGSSVVHRTLLELVAGRGLQIERSYQVNLGGNADFKNLLVRGDTKKQSKHNALGAMSAETVSVVPSGGFLPVLGDQKVGYIHVEAKGWGGVPATLELKLTVQDSSNAAGVIVDLVRIAALAHRAGHAGPVEGAGSLLKSPPLGDLDVSPAALDRQCDAFVKQLDQLGGLS
ncbi:inositol-3-phosphate synthase [Streptomyces sp. NPDC058964]|uniref:inositol-3-phosphate synthase n=1 Tax=Streptomyces sp. NPDC058964 TaxID=3346681 RepID=UPI0036AD4B99